MNRIIRNNAIFSEFDGEPMERIKENSINNLQKQIHERIDKRERITGKDYPDKKSIFKWPYCSIGMLQFKFQGNDAFGTGTLIGAYEVLTAAHNVYTNSKEFVTDIYFLTCYDGETFEKKVGVVEIFIPEEYKNDPVNSNEDYAVLILKDSLIENGYFGIYCLPYDKLRVKDLSLFGYPIEKIQHLPRGNFEMWGCSGRIEQEREELDINDNLLKYSDIITSSGQSGSAIFFQEGEGYYASSVHSFRKGFIGYGIHITEKRLTNIKLWTGIVQPTLHSQIILTNCGITSEGMKFLSRINLINIMRLELLENQINSEGIKYLAQCPMPKLKELWLDKNFICDEGIKYLGQCSFPHLTDLSIGGNSISNEGIIYLSKCIFPDLNILILDGNEIDSRGISNLKSCYYSKLKGLFLFKNKIGDIGINHLTQCSFPDLIDLDLRNNKIRMKEDAGRQLRSSFRNLNNLLID